MRRNCRRWVWALRLGALLSVHAPLTARADDEPPLAEIEVTAEPISETERRAPTAFVSVANTSTRENEFVTTADILQEQVGVQVQRFGGLGAFTTLSVRGSSANQIPVFLDGIPLSQAQDETVNLSNLPLDSVDRIEVYRGTVPVGFGGGGIGGVVNLVTKPAAATPTTELSAGYGSFETRKVVASHSEQLGGFDTLAHVTYLGSQGNFTYEDDNGTPLNPHDDETVTRINNAFNSVGLLLKGTRALEDGFAIDAVEEFFFKDQGVPGPASTQFSKPTLREARSLTYARLRAPGLADGAVDNSTSLYGVYNLQHFDDPEGNYGSVQNTRNQTMLVGASDTGTWYAPYGQAVGWFAECAYEAYFPYNATNPPALPASGPTQTRYRFTGALQDEIALLSDRLTVVPSLRYDHFLDDFSGVSNGGFPVTPPQTSNLDLVTPAAGIQGRLTPWLAVRGNIGRFQRAPSFSELFGNTGTVVGNPDLKPETGVNGDAGFIASTDSYGWLDHARIEAAYFHNNVSDLIAFTAVNPRQFKAENVGDAVIAGEEVAITLGAARHLNLELNYTHQNAENLTAPYEGKQLPMLPDNELFVRPSLFNDWGELYYEFTFIGSDPTDFINFTVVPSRAIHTAGAAYTPRPWIALTFEATNMTNADIRDLADFPLPGLSFFGGVKVVF